MAVENDYNLLVHNLNELAKTISELRDDVESRRLREAEQRLEPNETDWVSLIGLTLLTVQHTFEGLPAGCATSERVRQALRSSAPSRRPLPTRRRPPSVFAPHAGEASGRPRRIRPILGSFTHRPHGDPAKEDLRMESEAERNKGVVRRFIDEVQNKKNMDLFDELNAEDFVNLSAPPGMPSDREGGKMFLGGFLSAFPDSQLTIDDMIAEGDRVATRKTFTGTHTGDGIGIPPTGKPVSIQYVDILRLRDGRIIEHWLSMDQLSFMQQLGVIPTSEEAA